MGIASTINKKPVTIIGFISAFHSIVYGAGFIAGRGGFRDTLLYMNVVEFMSPDVFGILLLTVGILVAAGFVTGHDRLIRTFSSLQTFVWLFATGIYYVNGQFFLGTGIALTWVLLSWYMAYVHRNRDYMLRHALTDEE